MARLGLYPTPRPGPASSATRSPARSTQVGPGVTELTPGMRVVALTRFGGYAEAVAVPVAQVFPMPDGMGFEEAAAIPVNYLTAVLMLRVFGNVQAGDRVLVHAAAGRRRHGGHPALPDRGRRGDRHGVGARSTQRSAKPASPTCIDYRTQDFEAEVRRLTGGRGVDIVLDATGAFKKSYRCAGAARPARLLRPLGRGARHDAEPARRHRPRARAAVVPSRSAS